MAKAIKVYDNGLSIRFLKKPSKYFITFGNEHIKIDGNYNNGFNDFDSAEKYLFSLKCNPNTNYDWSIMQLN